jgi:hypothetical protein
MFVPTPHPTLGGARSDTYAQVVSRRRTSGRDGADRVHSITSTQGPLGDDIDRRAKRYLFQMSLRTICFLGAVFTWGRVPTAVSVALLVGAVVLPYIAVVLANAGRERPERADSFLQLREIAGAPVATPLAAARPVPPSGPGAPFTPSTPFTSGTPYTAGAPFTPDTPGTPTDGPRWADAGSHAADPTWTDPPWDDPQWRDARWDDPTGTPGTPRPDGSGRG